MWHFNITKSRANKKHFSCKCNSGTHPRALRPHTSIVSAVSYAFWQQESHSVNMS